MEHAPLRMTLSGGPVHHAAVIQEKPGAALPRVFAKGLGHVPTKPGVLRLEGTGKGRGAAVTLGVDNEVAQLQVLENRKHVLRCGSRSVRAERNFGIIVHQQVEQTLREPDISRGRCRRGSRISRRESDAEGGTGRGLLAKGASMDHGLLFASSRMLST